MKTTTTCPATEELRHLLDGELSGERQLECTEHLDSCAGCQARLEELATAGSNLSRVVANLHASEPAATSAYWPALQALDAGARESNDTGVPRPSARTRETPLNFLEPASDSAYLGRLAQFDVMRVLGRGGMGVVLEAFDSRLQRHVALKVLDPDLLDDETARQRFCREARAAASITHENVVAVHQVERSGDAGLPYLVMQLISGESLEQRLVREGRLPLREIVRIGMQAAHGLAAAHEQGLIHRDIKPGNILLEGAQDRVKLTDFGLARAAEDVKLTRTGFVSGTPLYMSPEQALGEPGDHRSDLFSLGAVLYEMCAGQPPFPGKSALVILRQIADAKPRPVRELNADIPEWFAGTIDHLLAKKPADRIQSAAQLAELLDFQWALLKTSSEELPQVCQIEERKAARRNRLVAIAIGAAFLAVGIFGGWLLAGRMGAWGEVSSARPTAVLAANSGAVWSVAFDEAGDTVAMAVEDGSVRLWDLPTQSVKSTLSAHRGVVWSSRFLPDGEQFVTAGDDGLIKVWKTGQEEPTKTIENKGTFEARGAVRGLALSRDGQTLFAGGRDGSLRIWSLASREPLAETQQPGVVYAVAVSPDDLALATAGSDKVVRLWNAKTLAQKLPLEGHTGPVYGLAFHPQGGKLASVGWDRTIRIWDTGSGQLLKSWEGHSGDIWGVVYSPNGARLATGGHDGAVRLWNVETGEKIATYLGHKIAIHSLAFSHDGALLASGGRDGTVRVWKMD